MKIIFKRGPKTQVLLFKFFRVKDHVNIKFIYYWDIAKKGATETGKQVASTIRFGSLRPPQLLIYTANAQLIIYY